MHDTRLESLIRASERHADDGRRSLGFNLQLTAALGLYALGPLVPGASVVYGSTTVAQALLVIGPGVALAWVSTLLYRRLGGQHRLYRASESVETTLLFVSNIAFPFIGGVLMTPLWLMPPFTAAFWALTKPFARGLYLSIIGGVHALLAALFLAGGDLLGASLTAAVAAFTALVFERLASGRRRALLLEKERDDAAEALRETLVERERERVAGEAVRNVGREVQAIVNVLEGRSREDDADPDEERALHHARTTLASLWSLADVVGEDATPLAELADRLRERCGAVCADVRFAFVNDADDANDDVTLPAAVAHRALRVGQELARNAVTHGGASSVEMRLSVDGALALTVSDDGSGLARETFTTSTRGLGNARAWAEEGGGAVTLDDAAQGTCLTLRLPLADDGESVAN